MTIFLIRCEGKTKYYIKDEERITNYNMKQFLKDKGRIRFSSIDDCKLFIVYCCGCGKTVEYHHDEDCRYFKCRVSDFCPFKVNIAKAKGKSKKEQDKDMYCLIVCKDHNHVVEDMKKIKDGMSMNIREKLQVELKAFHDQMICLKK